MSAVLVEARRGLRISLMGAMNQDLLKSSCSLSELFLQHLFSHFKALLKVCFLLGPRKTGLA